MKAARIKDYGEPSVIAIVEVDKPKVSDEQVLVEVYASCINPFDNTILTGALKDMMPLAMPLTLGLDIAGVITEVGSGVTALKPGDKVYGSAGVVAGGSGALAEFAATKQEQVNLMPSNVSFNEAASLVVTGQSAVQAIDKMGLSSGQKILIHGGAGGIGSLAIQYAKHLGLHVATTASGDGIDFAKELGADEVVDYKTARFEDTIKECDAVFDTIAGETYTRSFTVLKRGGIIISMNEHPNELLAETHGVRAEFQMTQTSPESLKKLADLVDQGVIKPAIGATFSLEETAQAFEAWRTGGVQGKVVVEIKR
ncbi:MAG: NADP-dependent oxidoreductase [Candidatus Saccharibacteria bacterium]|nr:NADP-dependent oxidoreductase [Candidatus Saccharibacteria bacterium]